jgi:hypothetical protein
MESSQLALTPIETTAAVCPPGPPNAAVLESGRHAGEALSVTMGGNRTFTGAV